MSYTFDTLNAVTTDSATVAGRPLLPGGVCRPLPLHVRPVTHRSPRRQVFGGGVPAQTPQSIRNIEAIRRAGSDSMLNVVTITTTLSGLAILADLTHSPI